MWGGSVDQGRPFKEDLWENKGLLYGLSAMATLTLVAALETIPPFNDYLQLVPLPVTFPSAALRLSSVDLTNFLLYEQFKWTMVVILLGDFLIAFAWDRLCLRIFQRA